jgi:hypothetical protein
MAVSILGLGLLALIATAVIAAVVVIGMLLVSPDTRGAGLAFLATGGLLALLIAGVGSVYTVAQHKANLQAVEGIAVEATSEVASDGWPMMSPLGTVEILLLVAFVLAVVALVRRSAGTSAPLMGVVGGVLMIGICGWYLWLGSSTTITSTVATSDTSQTTQAWDFATAPRIEIGGEVALSADGDYTPSADHGDTESTASQAPVEPDASADTSATAPASPGATDEAGEREPPPATDDAVPPPVPAAPQPPAPDNRPEWLDQGYFRVGDVVRRVVSAGPYATIEECELAMRSEIDNAVCRHVATLVGEQPVSMAAIGITPAFVMRECVVDQYAEQRESETGFTVWNQYARLEFSPSIDNRLIDRFQATERTRRVAGVALAGGGVMGLLAVVLGLLRLDTATKGYYTKRLFIGVPVAIIAVLGLLAMVVQ